MLAELKSCGTNRVLNSSEQEPNCGTNRSGPAEDPSTQSPSPGEKAAELTGKEFTRFQLSFCVRKRWIPEPRISWGSWAEYPNVSGSQNWGTGAQGEGHTGQPSLTKSKGCKEMVGEEGVMEKMSTSEQIRPNCSWKNLWPWRNCRTMDSPLGRFPSWGRP